VRRATDKITLPMVMEVIEAQEWGPSAPRIPPSEAKSRLAFVTAAKAVAMALTPGLEPIKFVTMWSRRKGQVHAVQGGGVAQQASGAWGGLVWSARRWILHTARPNIPPPQGPYIEFIKSEESLDPNWHPEEVEIMDVKTNFKVGA
jgi:hypothetical protein